ncbi:MAG: helicase HerA-like domain-containing protein, partial [Beijerinckiaceae bacterium]
LRALLTDIAENAQKLTVKYGNIAVQSVGAIQRALLVLENQGGTKFFGEPALELTDLIRLDRDGRGMINILAADKLMANPRLYATFLLWLVSELFEDLPEVGDLDRPKLVFFFDEAHLLFNDAPKSLLQSIEQVVRLIRSKGVGIYFVTQNPLDVPDAVLGQMGNRLQHALRAFTPRDQKAVQTAAETFRQNPTFKTAEVITQLAVGEALCSMLEDKGVPSIVQRTLVRPPSARVGPITTEERKSLLGKSAMRGKYDTPLDAESAYELLQKRRELAEQPAKEASTSGGLGGILGSIFGDGAPAPTGKGKTSGRGRMGMGELVARRVATTVAIQVGNAIVRGVLGSMTGGRR